jgi:GH24 family phage-related lysozyme (muramidase)
MSLETEAAIFVKKFEGYIDNATWDVNAYRLGHGSDTITFPDGSYRKVAKGDKTTREMAQKDLERRLKKEFIPKVETKIGQPYWNNLPENAKVGLISLAYNYGNVSKKSIVDAARSGDLNKLSIALVDSTYNDNKKLPENIRNTLRSRRAKEASLISSSWKKFKEKAVDVAKEAQETQQRLETYTKRNWLPIALVGVGVVGLIYVGYKYRQSKLIGGIV